MMLYQQFTSTLLSQLPFLAVYIIVLIIAAARRRQYAAISVLVIVAMATFILTSLISIFISLTPALWQSILPPAPIGTVYGVASFITGLLSAAGWVFLVAAVFFGRKEAPGALEPDPPSE